MAIQATVIFRQFAGITIQLRDGKWRWARTYHDPSAAMCDIFFAFSHGLDTYAASTTNRVAATFAPSADELRNDVCRMATFASWQDVVAFAAAHAGSDWHQIREFASCV